MYQISSIEEMYYADKHSFLRYVEYLKMPGEFMVRRGKQLL